MRICNGKKDFNKTFLKIIIIYSPFTIVISKKRLKLGLLTSFLLELMEAVFIWLK